MLCIVVAAPREEEKEENPWRWRIEVREGNNGNVELSVFFLFLDVIVRIFDKKHEKRLRESRRLFPVDCRC